MTQPSLPDGDAAVPPVAPRVTNRIELPTRTIFKVLIVLGIIWFLIKIWSILLLLFIAMIMAAALHPPTNWLQRRGLPRVGAVATVMLVLNGGIALVLILLIPSLIDQGREFATNLPDYIDRTQNLLKENPDLYRRLQDYANRGSAEPSSLLGNFLSVGATLVASISNALIVLVLTIYLLVDGRGIYRWLARDIPDEHKRKIDQAIPQLISVISGYVAGQALTSLLFGIFSFGVLTVLDVQQALLLAIIAALADAIPIAGVLIATVPAVLIAATDSLAKAAIVLVAYVVYQQIENYLIVPRVYKNTLQISSFAVLISVLIGGKLLGIVGVLLALPIAASIPVIERVWLDNPEEGFREGVREVLAGEDTLPDAPMYGDSPNPR